MFSFFVEIIVYVECTPLKTASLAFLIAAPDHEKWMQQPRQWLTSNNGFHMLTSKHPRNGVLSKENERKYHRSALHGSTRARWWRWATPSLATETKQAMKWHRSWDCGRKMLFGAHPAQRNSCAPLCLDPPATPPHTTSLWGPAPETLYSVQPSAPVLLVQ